ncbi:MCE family protein [Gordonia sp. TBRC 11910]|uniref:MCE family protein n=1 Tax=Gordonia asplenii TaxID=2725283 RepID=A0A848KZS0_9ACTN|nr:MlaD family protein [Gordonia asplenii]NMO01893.1 MCE family protein [Gordonia asplenii]
MPPLGVLERVQIVALVVLGIVATAFAGVRYVHVDRMVGLNSYRVVAALPESGGIFVNAEVTYQGVPAGRVTDLRLTRDGVDVVLSLDGDQGRIPASSVAVVANRSAIGEQYVDLQPTSASGPFLYDGARITKASVPPPLDDVVRSALDFAESVPIDDLHTVITELGKAFDGQGENLSRLVTSLGRLSSASVESLPETIALLKNSNVVLATQADQSDAVLDWSRNLDLVTATLASADPDVRRLLTTGTATASHLSTLLQQQGADVGRVVHDLGSTASTIAPAGWATNSALAMLSMLSASSHGPVHRNGLIYFGIVLETNNPAACTRGYEGTTAMIEKIKRTNPRFDINYDDFPLNTNANCAVPQGSPTGVRDANRAALSNPAYPQPWDGKPKVDADRLNLNPLAQQLAALLGVHPR